MTDERRLELIAKIQSANPTIDPEKMNYLIDHWDDSDEYRDAGSIKSIDDMKRIYKDVDMTRYNKYLEEKEIIRSAIKSYYEFESVRISIGNRIVASFNIQNGQTPSSKKEEMNDDALKQIKLFELEYRRITDAYVENKQLIKNIIKKNQGSGTSLKLTHIRNMSDYYMIDAYVGILEKEENLKKVVELYLREIPIYTEFLAGVKGCGTLMSGVIITYFDIYKAKYKSSFIKYAGIDTYYDEDKGKYVGTTKAHTVMVDYIDKNGETKTKNSITYQPFLKTKLLGVLTGSFIKSGSDYATPYYEYKNRKLNDPRMKDEPLAHIDKMAKRYMLKIFLSDLFVKWKEIEGLPVPVSYEERFLGIAPHKFDPLADYKASHPEQFKAKK